MTYALLEARKLPLLTVKSSWWLMAPTETLARQHHRVLSRICPAPVALLAGSIKGRERARLLRAIADGSAPLIVGTHALFQDKVEYADLALDDAGLHELWTDLPLRDTRAMQADPERLTAQLTVY